MKYDYDSKLLEIDFYRYHREYLPYIGEHYEKYKVLHVGESHYICLDKTNEEKYNLDYFRENWFNSNCEEILQLDEGAYNTRDVLCDYLEYGLTGKRRYNNIFQNFINTFIDSGVCKEEDLENKRELYKNMAFINFMQMPALYDGKSLYTSFITNSQHSSVSADEMWEYVARKSTEIFDQVVEIIEPKLIVFTSSQARDAYMKNGGKYSEIDDILYLCHPGCSWWNRSNGSRKSSREQLEEVLKNTF